MVRTSYEFHRGLESPIKFVRREWQALAMFGGGFLAIYLVGIFAVDASYFYPRLITDSLYYYLKGLTFVETGHTMARNAINSQPFAFVSLPGLLRAPFIMAFRDFDNQLRAIQISNVLLVGLIAVMYAYVLSWIVPRKWHWLAIGFSFGFMLLNPDWGGNVFAILADAPYAAAAIAFLIVAARVLSSDRPLREQRWWIAGGAILFVVAFFLRFSAPVLLVYVAVLAAGRQIRNRAPLRVLLQGAGVSAVLLALLISLNWKMLTGRYLIEPVLFLLHSDKGSVMMHLLALALPSQIVPRFQRGFTHDPILDPSNVYFGTAPRDLVLVTIGFAISATTFFGMWRARHRFAPEIAYTLAALPVLALMIPSTTRYLIAYQPLFWIFFYAGASALAAPIVVRLAPRARAALVIVALVLLSGTAAAYLRSRSSAQTDGSRGVRISIGETRAYSTEVASTFGALRGYLDTLPREHTFLIGTGGTTGRWKAISGLDYYRPDTALSVAVRQRDTYLVVECATLDLCRDFEGVDRRFRERIDKYGKFSFDPKFERTTDHAKVRVYLIRDSQ